MEDMFIALPWYRDLIKQEIFAKCLMIICMHHNKKMELTAKGNNTFLLDREQK